MPRFFSASLVLLLLFAGAANAADLRRPYYIGPYSWAGFYLGVSGGYVCYTPCYAPCYVCPSYYTPYYYPAPFTYPSNVTADRGTGRPPSIIGA